MDKSVFKTQKGIKKFNEAFGWRLAPHVLRILAACEKSDIVGVSESRQNFKTETGDIFLFDGALQGESGVFFAHNGTIMREAMRRMVAICKPLVAQGIVTKVNDNHGFKEIVFARELLPPGKREDPNEKPPTLYFRIRTFGASDGLTVDRVVIDEAQKMDDDFWEELQPVLTRSKSKKILMIGTPPKPEDLLKFPTGPFHRMKHEKADNWIEYSAAEYVTPELTELVERAKLALSAGVKNSADLKAVFELSKKANPAHPFLPDFRKTFENELATMNSGGFIRQRLGVWTDTETLEYHEPYFRQEQVASFLTDRGTRESTFVAGLGIAPDSKKAYVTMNDGKTIEVAAEFDLTEGGLDEIIEWLYSKGRSYRVVTIPANVRGKTVEQMLREKNFKKGVLSNLPSTATHALRMIKQLEDGDLKISSNPTVKTAIGSFWLSFDDRSGSSYIDASVPEDAVLVMSMALAVHHSLSRARPAATSGTATPQKNTNWSF